MKKLKILEYLGVALKYAAILTAAIAALNVFKDKLEDSGLFNDEKLDTDGSN